MKTEATRSRFFPDASGLRRKSLAGCVAPVPDASEGKRRDWSTAPAPHTSIALSLLRPPMPASQRKVPESRPQMTHRKKCGAPDRSSVLSRRAEESVSESGPLPYEVLIPTTRISGEPAATARAKASSGSRSGELSATSVSIQTTAARAKTELRSGRGHRTQRPELSHQRSSAARTRTGSAAEAMFTGRNRAHAPLFADRHPTKRAAGHSAIACLSIWLKSQSKTSPRQLTLIVLRHIRPSTVAGLNASFSSAM